MTTVRVVSKKKVIYFSLGLIVFLMLLTSLSFLLWYKIGIGKVSHQNQIVAFEVGKNDTYMTLGSKLKQQKLIRNVLAYKIFLKLHPANDLQIGYYPLKQNMDVKQIVEVLKKGPDMNLTNIKLTFPEGINVRQFAKIIEKNTKYKQQEVYELLKDTNFIDSLIQKYWFLTEKIKNKQIYYSLEGYLFPDTYILKKDSTLKEIIVTILNNTEKKVNPYKTAIEKSAYTVHDILTLASIVELEAQTKSDRKKVAGVFFNRLDKKMGLESDVTTYYGLKKELTDSIAGHVYDENPYNTRNSSLRGKLPIGPIGNPSITSIDAVINYEKTSSLYFVADVNKKVYFTDTYLEHQKIIQKLKDQNKWNA